MGFGKMKLAVLVVTGGVLRMPIAMSADFVAAPYPQRPITLVVGYVPGGGADTLARLLARHMSDELGQRVIVENRPGAAGTVAALAVARSEPDGYTVYMAGISSALHQLTAPSNDLDLSNDLVPIGMAAEVPLVLVMGNHVPATAFLDAAQVARNEPGKLSCASVGVGSLGNVMCNELERRLGIRLLHIPYKGDAQAMAEVMAGRADFFISSLVAVLSYIKAGRVRGLAILSGGRVAQLPDVPGLEEFSFMGPTSVGWYVLMVPRSTPDHAISRLNRSLGAVLALTDVRETLENLGYVVPASPKPPEAVEDYIDLDMKKWSTLLQQGGSRTIH